MKNQIFVILLISFFVASCRETTEFTNLINPTLGGVYTEIEGDISGALSFNDSPFLVVNDIFVPSNSTLKIEAGVTLFFKDGKRITSAGTLLAEGTKQKPIVFTPFSISWGGISIVDQSDTTKFKFCIVQNVFLHSSDIQINGAIEIVNSNVIVENCVIEDNNTVYGGGVFLINSGAVIKNSIFRNNDAEVYGGGMFLQNSTVEIINNTIYKNTCFNYGGGFVFWDPQITEIQNNIFYKNFSFTGDNRISIVTGDSLNITEQYNYLAFGTMNPLFISNDNLHLSSDSPCINNGNPDPEYNDSDGTRNNQGAFGGPLGEW